MRQSNGKRWGSTLAALAGVWLAMVAAAPAQAAPADIPIIAITDDGVAHQIPRSHTCKAIPGHDRFGNHAIHCADLWGFNYGDFTGNVYANTSVYCENAANAVVQCAGIHATAAVCNPTGCSSFADVCGARFGHTPCPAGHWLQTEPATHFKHCSRESWGDNLDATVVLPQSGTTVGGAYTNVASPHYFVIVESTAQC
jgi:hypothetical protein